MHDRQSTGAEGAEIPAAYGLYKNLDLSFRNYTVYNFVHGGGPFAGMSNYAGLGISRQDQDALAAESHARAAAAMKAGRLAEEIAPVTVQRKGNATVEQDEGVRRATTAQRLVDINEAFAGETLASARDLDLPSDRVNVSGGAIALSHPVGMSGARLVLSLATELRRRDGGTGAAALCGGGGQGDALIIRVPAR
jgi:acetyl-CoA C-acetyltransferase